MNPKLLTEYSHAYGMSIDAVDACQYIVVNEDFEGIVDGDEYE